MTKHKTKKKQVKSRQKTTKSSTLKQKNIGLQWLPIIAVLLITTICFLSSLDNQFVNWDDDRNFYDNELITSLTDDNFWSNTVEIFKTPVIGNYNPLTNWTFLIEHKIFGLDNPYYWHLDNLLLHLLCVLLVFKICLMLGLKWRGAVFVALLFGIHPMRVESVAWVTERKDVLFGVFYLAAIYFYLKQKLGKKATLYHGLLILCFVLSLFSKIQAVVLPLSLIAIDYYTNNKLTFSAIINKLHLFGLSLAFGLLGIYFLQGQGSLESTVDYAAWQRIFVGSYSYLIYLVKSIVPYELSPLYPYPATMPWYFYASIVIAPLTLLMGFWAFIKKHKMIVFGLAFFTFNVMFLLQILGAGQGFLADRFTYIAYFGLFFIAGYYFEQILKQPKISQKPALIYIPCLLILGVYGFMTYNQNKIWKNSATLWTHVLKYYNKTTLPFGNRANYYRDNGFITEALQDYSQCIRLLPNQANHYNSRGRLYFNTKNNRDTLLLALKDYNKAVELEPNNGEYLINRCAAHARLGNLEQALADVNKGLSLKPDHVSGYINRFVLNSQLGNYENALKDIQTHIQYQPYAANSWYESARLKVILKRPQEALKDYNKAIKLNSNNGLFYYERAKLFYNIKDRDKAVQDYNRAQSLGYKVDPSFGALLRN